MKWLKKVLGIADLVKAQEETNKLLKLIEQNTRELARYQKTYNQAYHIK